jgi:hypothetical protein
MPNRHTIELWSHDASVKEERSYNGHASTHLLNAQTPTASIVSPFGPGGSPVIKSTHHVWNGASALFDGYRCYGGLHVVCSRKDGSYWAHHRTQSSLIRGQWYRWRSSA